MALPPSAGMVHATVSSPTPSVTVIDGAAGRLGAAWPANDATLFAPASARPPVVGAL